MELKGHVIELAVMQLSHYPAILAGMSIYSYIVDHGNARRQGRLVDDVCGVYMYKNYSTYRSQFNHVLQLP